MHRAAREHAAGIGHRRRVRRAVGQPGSGPGEYQWSIDRETLTFTPVEPRDPCDNRIIFLEDASYTRVE